MKILLVRPRPSPETIGLQHVMIVEPLELEILSVLCRSHDEVTLADLIIEKKSLNHYLQKVRPDVLCLTGYITNVSTMKSYCTAAKQLDPQIKTIVGGVHCEVCPGDFKDESIDYRVVRNASTIFTALLDHIEHGKKMPEGVLTQDSCQGQARLPEFDFRIPHPDRDITRKYRKKYFYIFHDRVALIKTSFGCPYTCNFCFCCKITNGLYRQRPVDEVIDELDSIDEREIYIVDDDFLTDRKRLHSFIGKIKERGIRKRYLVYGRADFIAGNPDVIEKLKDIGLRTIIIGFESFSQGELDQYEKKIKVRHNIEAMRVLNRLKIDAYATIIVSPAWDKKDFRQMIRTVKELGIHYVNLQPLTPLPGTGITVPESDLLIRPEEFEKWDLAHVSIRPEKLDAREFYKEIISAYKSILYQPRVLLKYLVSYSPRMLWKMLSGSMRVHQQYRKKINNTEPGA
jgi:radical SAM superfamily enzyme YgiQ (UPF0313 family)